MHKTEIKFISGRDIHLSRITKIIVYDILEVQVGDGNNRMISIIER